MKIEIEIPNGNALKMAMQRDNLSKRVLKAYNNESKALDIVNWKGDLVYSIKIIEDETKQ